MTKKIDLAEKHRYRERRAGEDRRKFDKGPPGNHERRRSMEPRKPEVVELEMTDSEWAALNGKPPPLPAR
jgi:hypothetical protein